MNAGLDTSVLLRLLIGTPPAQARKAVQFLDNLFRSGGKACVSDLVVAETYFALQFHYGIAKGDALAGLAALLSTGEITAIEWAHVDWERKLIRLPDSKTNEPRTIHLSDAALEVLKTVPRISRFVVAGAKPENWCNRGSHARG
jgi:integrase